MTRARMRALQAGVLATGAPLGWLLIETLRGASPLAVISAAPALYGYMLVASLIAFGLFGLALGEREDRLQRINRKLEQLSVTDGLTGLRNARYFHTRLDEEQAESLRTGVPLGLAILDLDHFKRINDQHGHPAGDEVLIGAAHAIAAVTRQGETAARVGGEEFGLLLPGSDARAAHEAAERVRRAIGRRQIRLSDGTRVRITASAGVASTSALPRATTHQLYRAADEALYAAKRTGRDRTVTAAGGAAQADSQSTRHEMRVLP
ncbi:MAG: GGDEF domain-containing protein [Gemmatimonadetes bacterium]|nr:GGDEF domain-containing protein [Gemmatimonadota bacterium]